MRSYRLATPTGQRDHYDRDRVLDFQRDLRHCARRIALPAITLTAKRSGKATPTEERGYVGGSTGGAVVKKAVRREKGTGGR